AGTLAAGTAGGMPRFGINRNTAGQLALLGGQPVREGKQWPSWPPWDTGIEERVIQAGKRGGWSRINSTSKAVEEFETAFARLIGTRYALGTGSGTQALHTALGALGIGAGDEVLMPPFTDKGTMTAIFRTNALPIFVDEELDSFQMDPEDAERKITEHTRAIVPVHIMGQPADMDRIMAIARRHDLYVIEDACQAHATTYHGQRLGTIGDISCYSFQASKTLACGEGGGITCDNETLMNKCYAYHNHGMGRGEVTVIGPKYRMNEFEAAVLLGQLPGFEQRAQTRLENAGYLREKLESVPGIQLQNIYGDTQGTYLLFGFLYLKEHFDELPREKFFEAVRAEGVPMGGYINDELQLRPSVDATIQSPTYQKLYSKEQLARFQGIRTSLPVNKKLCTGDVIAMFSHQYLLGDRQDMDDIADAIQKVYENRRQLLS
ncbi:MAG TPA: DegT/DnrJ/EryC1/StrS family aminotransferase, partial [bacterium]|nr:DegT/DnrJ/EryC1/StrS family aminotransferase [bacterium]